MGDDFPAPEPERPLTEREARKVGECIENWTRATGDGYQLHPDTEPDAILDAQERDVRVERERRPRATVEEIAEACDLPVWNVRRILEADA